MVAADHSSLTGCYECSRRRIDCDRQEPECFKCLSRALKCSGLGVRYRFNNGIASRGRMVGKSCPVRGDASPVEAESPMLRSLPVDTPNAPRTPPSPSSPTVESGPVSSISPEHSDNGSTATLGFSTETSQASKDSIYDKILASASTYKIPGPDISLTTIEAAADKDRLVLCMPDPQSDMQLDHVGGAARFFLHYCEFPR